MGAIVGVAKNLRTAAKPSSEATEEQPKSTRRIRKPR